MNWEISVWFALLNKGVWPLPEVDKDLHDIIDGRIAGEAYSHG
jgi:hypothetical protein